MLKQKNQELFFTAFFVLATGLSIYRSCILDMTNDEAYSFLLVSTYNWKQALTTANTHWLNSLCMFLESKCIGNKECFLRIHSIAAYMISMIALYKMFKPYKQFVWLVMTLLASNFYLLDYFPLARGYSLAVCFELLACYYIMQHVKQNSSRIYTCLSLAVFSNYTCIYFLISFMMLDFVQQLKINSKEVLAFSFLKKRMIGLLTLVIAITNIFLIRYVSNDLREGDTNGFLKDTLAVFINRMFHEVSFSASLIVSSIGFGFLIFYYGKYLHKIPASLKRLIQLILLTFLLIEFNFIVFQIPYPMGRTSIFFNTFFIVTLCMIAAQYWHQLPMIAQSLIPVIVFTTHIIFLIRYKPVGNTLEYTAQQGIKQCFSDLYGIEGPNIKNCKVGMSIDHYGSFKNYYKQLDPEKYPDLCFVYGRGGYEKLGAQEKSSLNNQNYLLMLGNYKGFLDKHISPQQYKEVKYYPDMNTTLIKIIPE